MLGILNSEEIKGSKMSNNQLLKCHKFIIKAIQETGAHFAISTLSKKFFLEIEITQQCLDPCDNYGIPLIFHDRRIQMLASRELFAIASACDAINIFWQAQLATDEEKFYEGYANFCKIIADELPSFETSPLMKPIEKVMRWNSDLMEQKNQTAERC